MASENDSTASGLERQVWVGCSGYVYKHWRGRFYPEGLPESQWLTHYVKYFPTVELNNTHYIMPSEASFESWRERSPDTFLFAVKASRFITHMKKLKEPEEPLRLLLSRAELLGPKLGPFLFQLPPRWRFNAERLRNFLAALPREHRHTLEVRDPSWLNPELFTMLEEFGVAFCISSLPLYETPILATAPFVYIRFHGSRTMYYYDYPTEELRQWCDIIMRFVSEGRTVYCYFDNDPEGWAVEDALELMEMLRGAGARV